MWIFAAIVGAICGCVGIVRLMLRLSDHARAWPVLDALLQTLAGFLLFGYVAIYYYTYVT
jgi:uncharacterized membrane protein HdeD (DUF308 family)